MKSITLIFLFLSGCLYAQEAGDIGYLYHEDGAVIHGTIVQVSVLGDVTIRMNSGIELTIKARQISRFKKDKYHFMGNRMPKPGSLMFYPFIAHPSLLGDEDVRRYLFFPIFLGGQLDYVISPFSKVGIGVRRGSNYSILNTQYLYFCAYERQVVFRGVALYAGVKPGLISEAGRSFNSARYRIKGTIYHAKNIFSFESYVGINIFTKRRLSYRLDVGLQEKYFVAIDRYHPENENHFTIYSFFLQLGIGF